MITCAFIPLNLIKNVYVIFICSFIHAIYPSIHSLIHLITIRCSSTLIDGEKMSCYLNDFQPKENSIKITFLILFVISQIRNNKKKKKKTEKSGCFFFFIRIAERRKKCSKKKHERKYVNGCLQIVKNKKKIFFFLESININ